MSNPNIEPLAQDHVIVAQTPHPETGFFHDPGITRLDDGTLIVAAPQWHFQRFGGDQTVRILRSVDGGQTWDERESVSGSDATPFVVDGQLLMFFQKKSHRDFMIMASDNNGLTWTSPKTVMQGPVWNISTPMVTRPGTLYWAMDYDVGNGHCHSKVMVRLNRHKSALDPDAWSISNIVSPPELPVEIVRDLYPQPVTEGRRSAFWLEPNTVDVAGKIRVFTRCNIDRYATANIAAVLDYDENINHLRFTQLTAWPGGQCKFFIIHDPENRMYWMLGNLVTNSQDLLQWGDRWRKSQHGPSGNERRWLFLHYSIDCLTWFPAGCVARWPDSVHKSFMYPSAVVDGNDLVILSRTSRDSGDQHNADLCTLHRVRNFRDLAMDLHAGSPSE
ncbi:glycoside hydrolase [Dehalococcoidia bacterium]|nr:glycoside hydrolase [Dehalococcoidia bacterium]